MRVYRIGDAKGDYPVYSGKGSSKIDGRWHNAGQVVIYAARYYSTAVLEKLVRTGEMPPNQHFVEIDIPTGVTYEVVTKDRLPGWCDEDMIVSRHFGSVWLRECRSAILIVPSVVARIDENVLINPNHHDFQRITRGFEKPVWWDARLFAPRSAGGSEPSSETDEAPSRMVTAPILGTVTKVVAAPGLPVDPGDELVTIESMKMLNEISCPWQGIVNKVHVKMVIASSKDNCSLP
jgi:RES domain-containing protein